MVDFTPTKAEQKVIDTARTGGTADFRVGDEKADDPASGETWGPERTIRAEVIWALCTGAEPSWKVHPSGITIFGARILGKLDFDSATLNCGLWLFSCSFDQEIVLRDARTRTIGFAGSHVSGIRADRVRVEGACVLRRGFHATGEIRLLGAEIRGDLDLSGASLLNPKADALSVDGAKIRGSVFLTKGFKADGGIRLLGAEIGGQLSCTGAELSNPDGNAIFADGAKIRGDVFLDKGFKADGAIRLLGAEIGGDLGCAGAELSNPDGDAISADNANIGGSVFLSGGFKAAGGVRFIGAEIGGQMVLRGATFNNGTDVALGLERAQVAGSLIVDSMPKPPVGTVNLAGSSVGYLVDDLASWPAEGQLVLDGFNYMTIGGNAPTDARARIDWLRLQPRKPFRPQPYEQLIKVLRSMGHDRDARAVAIAKQEDLRRRGDLEWWARAWNWLLGVTIGHGYQPWKVLYFIVPIIFLGWVIFIVAKHDEAMMPAKESVYLDPRWKGTVHDWMPANYPGFKPFVYSLDLFLPIVDLQQKAYWMPNEQKPFGRLVRIYRILHIALGWIFTTVAVLGFTGVVKKD